jgi:hypothetical protein
LYSEVQRQQDVLEGRLQRWASDHEELGRMVVALLMVAVIVLFVSLMGGYVDVRSKEQLGKWIDMKAGDSEAEWK